MSIYTIKAQANGEAELLIYGYIGDWENSAKNFAKQIKELKAHTLNIRINSGGGSLFDGQAIYTLIKDFSGKKVTYIDGLAASAASIIAMAGDEIIMPQNALIMIHNVSTCADGNSQDFAKISGDLAKFDQAMRAVYVAKTGLSDEQVKQMMDEETFMTAEEAYKLGFVTKVVGKMNIEAGFNSEGLLVLNGVSFNLPKSKINDVITKTNATYVTSPNSIPEQFNLNFKGATGMQINAEILKQEHKEVYEQIYNEAYKAGIKAERERIKQIEALTMSGHTDIITIAKFDTGISAEATAMAIIQAEAKQRNAYVTNVVEDALVINEIPASINIETPNNLKNDLPQNFWIGFNSVGKGSKK